MASNLQYAYNPNQTAQSLALQLGTDQQRQSIQSQQLNDALRSQLAPIQLAQAQQDLQNSQNEAPIKQALQKMLLAQKGVFLSPQRAGMPASLPALPVPQGANSLIQNTPDNAPLNPEVLKAPGSDGRAIPQQLGGGAVFDQLTQNENLGQILQRELNKKQVESDIDLEKAKQLHEFETTLPGKPIAVTNPTTGETKYIAPKTGESFPEGFIPASEVVHHVGPDGNQIMTKADLQKEIQDSKNAASTSRIEDRDVLRYSKDLTTELNKLPAIKDYPEIEKRAKAIEEDLKHDNKAIADTIMVENLQRLTSNQAIRQQTLNMLIGHQSLWDKIKGKISSTVDGGIGFSELTRGEVKEVAKVALESAQIARNEILNGYRTSAHERGDQYGDVFDKQVAPKYPGYKIPNAPVKPDGPISVSTKQEYDSLASGTQYIDPNGHIGTKR